MQHSARHFTACHANVPCHTWWFEFGGPREIGGREKKRRRFERTKIRNNRLEKGKIETNIETKETGTKKENRQ